MSTDAYNFRLRFYERLAEGHHANVYHLQWLEDQHLRPFCEIYKIGTDFTFHYLESLGPFRADYVAEKLLSAAAAEAIAQGKDVYVQELSIEHDSPTEVVKFKLRLLLLGDISSGFYFDHNLGEIVSVPRDNDDQDF